MRLRDWKAALIAAAICLPLSAPQAEPMDANTIFATVRASNLETEIYVIVDFELAAKKRTADASGFVVEGPESHQLLAYDGAGGEYHLLADGRILRIDSEGSAGVVARDFTEFLGITTGLSSWLDALRFASEGDARAARTEWTAYEAEWELKAQLEEPWSFDSSDFSTATPAEGRARIVEYFGIEPLADPFGALHRAVTSLNDDVAVYWDGERYGSFGGPRP